jgi:hypothetical protein
MLFSFLGNPQLRSINKHASKCILPPIPKKLLAFLNASSFPNNLFPTIREKFYSFSSKEKENIMTLINNILENPVCSVEKRNQVFCQFGFFEYD